jgi:hypothetical protein
MKHYQENKGKGGFMPTKISLKEAKDRGLEFMRKGYH